MERQLRVWDIGARRVLKEYTLPDGIFSVAASPNSSYIAVGYATHRHPSSTVLIMSGCCVRVYTGRLESPKVELLNPDPVESKRKFQLTLHTGSIFSLKYVPSPSHSIAPSLPDLQGTHLRAPWRVVPVCVGMRTRDTGSCPPARTAPWWPGAPRPTPPPSSRYARSSRGDLDPYVCRPVRKQ